MEPGDVARDGTAKADVCIATVDIGPLLTRSNRTSVEEDQAATASSLLARACETHGLLFVSGHGITPEKRRLAFDNAKRFFSLPEDVKRKIPAKRGGFTRGYIGFGGESGSQRLECKEAFSYGYPWPANQPPTNALQGPNIWPDERDLGEDWRESMIDLFRLMVFVHEAIARGLSIALGLPHDDNLSKLCEGGDTISLMRLFHYFPYENNAERDASGGLEADSEQGQHSDRDTGRSIGDATIRQEKIGSSPHTDWGFSTSILQDGAGGLQFLEQNSQKWIDVPCADEDLLVVNCGDYLSLFTKGRLKSPVHQVVSTGKERTSFVFFYYPSFDSALPSGNTDSSTATTKPAGTTKSSDTDKTRQSVGFNTLLDLEEEVGEGDDCIRKGPSFGQYLARKWGDVFRG